MADKSDGCPNEDRIFPGPQLGKDGPIPFIRHLDGCGMEGGVFMPAKEGQDLSGQELVHLVKDDKPGYRVESIYKGKPVGKPAMVNSKAFMNNWTNIFGSKTTVGEA